MPFMSHDATPLLDLQVRTVVSLHAHASQPLELAFVVNRSAGEIGVECSPGELVGRISIGMWAIPAATIHKDQAAL